MKTPHRLTLAACAFMLLGALTPAEEASRTERPLTAPERERLARDCALPPVGAALEGLEYRGRTARVTELPPQTLLVLVAVHRGDTSKGHPERVPRQLPLLPNGGIGARDICGIFQSIRLDERAVGQPVQVGGVRVRPGLDLEAEYPTFAADLRARKVYFETRPGRYAVLPVGQREARTVAEGFANHPAIDPARAARALGDRLYLPLKSPGS